MQSIFLDKIKGKPTGRPPVWFMRQAGRVLPNYNKLKEKYSFRELMHDPVLAARVTLMPVHDLGVDAAILFSDILVIPEAMGMEAEFTDHGPVFSHPLKEYSHPANELKPDPAKLEYIYQAIDEIIRIRPVNIPLIGFCGAPLTTLCYMMQGISSTPGFPDATRFLFRNKAEAKKLIAKITELSVHYALKQIEHGVDAFQLFETHANLIPEEMYLELFMPAIETISKEIRKTRIPLIFFPKGFGAGLRKITPEVADFVGIDWQMPLTHARELVHPEIGLQGNLDPRILYAEQKVIAAELEKYLPFYNKNQKWIFNLGHGFLPDTPYENAKFVVNWVKNTSWKP
ncbi:MAG: uroporphyrinogen decarboxylase [Prolixibacteraceae bacterium]